MLQTIGELLESAVSLVLWNAPPLLCTPPLALTNKRPVAVIGELFQDQSRAQSDEQSRRSSVKVLRIQQSGRGPLLLLGELLCQTKDL